MSASDPTFRAWGAPPSLDDIAELARQTLERLDEPFRSAARGVPIKVEDFADEETLQALNIDNPYELTGLYSGTALPLETPSAPSQAPAMVWLFRLPILDEWAAAGELTLEELIANVVIHELGHHFGWSDEEMEALESGA